MTDWLPIESAPRDGAAILTWCVHPFNDDRCAVIATCGGSGLIELPASPPPADKTQEDGK